MNLTPPPEKKPKRKKRLVIGIVAGVAALALAGTGTAYGINAANVRAYDEAATHHAELLDSAALAEVQLPLAQHDYVAAWHLATAEKGSTASQVAAVTSADDKIVGKDAKAGLAPLAKALKTLAADDAAAPTEDELAASDAVQKLLDAEDTDASAFAPADPTGQFALSDEGADTGAKARAEVDAAVATAQERLDELNSQLEDVEARHDAVDAVLIASAPQLLAAAENAVELAPAWKKDHSKAKAKAFNKALMHLQAAIDSETEGKTEAKPDNAEALFETPHTVEPDAEALSAAQVLLPALSDYVAQANALQQAHADAVAAEKAAAAATEAAAAQQPSYDGGDWTGDSSGSGNTGGGGGQNTGGGNTDGGGGRSTGGGNTGGGGSGNGGFTGGTTGGVGGHATPPPPGTCYKADTSGPEICY